MKPKEKSRISRITVARLYNIGNYEHIRYELTADVPEGNSAKIAISKLVRILRNANPKPLAKMTDYDHNTQDTHQRIVKDVEAWVKGTKEALELLHKFGGTADHKDAKLEWDDYPF